MKKSLQAILLCIIFTAAFVAYSNHFNNAFHFDDSHTIVQNEYIRELDIPLFFKDARTFSSLPANQSYRPGLTTLNALDVFLSGSGVPTPYTFHLSIFISYLCSGFLLYLLILYILSQHTDSKWNYILALFSCAWFLLHTANAETINYIIARSDSFSTLMVLLSFVVYLYIPASRRMHLYLIPMIIGFTVKEHTIMFVPVLFIYQFLFEQKSSFHLWKERKNVGIVFRKIALPLVTGIGLFIFSKVMTPHTWVSGGEDRWSYLFTQFFVYFHYVYNFILPVNLVVDTDWKLVPSLVDDKVFAGLLFVISLGYIAFKTSLQERYKGIAFGICWFFIALIPTSSIFPFAEVLNDHRTFFPYIGLFIAVATLLQNLVLSPSFKNYKPASPVFYIAAVILLTLHAYGTYQRNEVWHSEESLWKETTVKAPGNSRAWMNYGITLMAKGNYQEAESCFTKAKELAPSYSYVYINLGIAKQATGRGEEAEVDFKQALSLNADVPEAYSFYAKYLLSINRLPEAKRLIDKGLALSPAHQLLNELQLQLTQLSVNKTEHTEKMNELMIAKESPAAANYLNLSLAYYNAGKYDSCIFAAQQALKSDPAYDLAYNNICAAYNRLKDWNKAIEAGEKGLKINPENKLLKANLNESYAKKAVQKSSL